MITSAEIIKRDQEALALVERFRSEGSPVGFAKARRTGFPFIYRSAFRKNKETGRKEKVIEVLGVRWKNGKFSTWGTPHKFYNTFVVLIPIDEEIKLDSRRAV